MALPVKNGSGILTSLKTTLDGADHVPHHIIDSVATPVSVIQSGSWSVTIGAPGATSISKAEDAASADGDVGIGILVVRRDTAAHGVGADGDYGFLSMNSAGRLWTSSTIDAALPAGTNAIGKLAANTGVIIGSVDGTFAEDAAAAGGELGVAILAVRRDTASSGVGTNGDFANFSVDANGRLWTTTEGTYAEDAASASADKGVFVLAVRNDTPSAMTGTDGDYSAIAVDDKGRVFTKNDVQLPAALDSGLLKVTGFPDVGSILLDGVKYPVKAAFFTSAAPGTLDVFAAVASHKLRILSLSASASGSQQITFKDGVAPGTTIFGYSAGASGAGVFAPQAGYVCETSSGNALRVTFASGTIYVWVTYIEVP